MIYAECPSGARLGNWMFTYAAAVSTGEPVTVTGDEYARDVVCGKYRDLFRGARFAASVPDDIRTYVEPNLKAVHYAPLPVRKGEDLRIVGFFQSEKFLDEQKVRELYRISPTRRTHLQTRYREVLAVRDIVAIHVRRGDYLRVGFHDPFVGEPYLRRAVNAFLDDGKTAFLVFSDDIPWCRRFFDRSEFAQARFWYSGNDDPLDDLYLMSLCAHNVVSNSSFSWWGAWLNENPSKRVIAPSMWFGFDTKRNSWGDIYFRGMEVVRSAYTLPLFVSAAYWYARRAIGEADMAMRRLVLRTAGPRFAYALKGLLTRGRITSEFTGGDSRQ